MEYGNFANAKVYNDGSHYIAIPQQNRPIYPKKVKNVSKEEQELKEIADKIFDENKGKRKKDKIENMEIELNKVINNEQTTKQYVKEYMDKKTRNLIEKRKRLTRKVNLGTWNYFCTFTYDDKKVTEEEFRKKLSNCLKKFSSKKGWKYIGVWERSPEKNRLHFHGLFNIPNGSMVGELIEVNDYSFKTHDRQITHQNTYFSNRFGRNDFDEIEENNPFSKGQALRYLMKYLEKSGERIVYSRNTPTYIISDIMDNDIICPMSSAKVEKYILSDNFGCWDEGCYMGQVSPEVISQMRKAN